MIAKTRNRTREYFSLLQYLLPDQATPVKSFIFCLQAVFY